MKHYFLSFLFSFFLLSGVASTGDNLAVEKFVFNGNSDNAETDAPIESGYILFSRYVGLTDSAEVRLCNDDGTVASCRPQVGKRQVMFDFGRPFRMPKGKPFWLELAKGSVYKLTTKEVQQNEIRKHYRTMDSFTWITGSEFYKKMKSLSSGMMLFETNVRKDDDAKFLLYRDGRLAEKCDAKIEYFDNTAYVTWDFGRTVYLDKGVRYKFVLPAGSVYSVHRADIRNREISFDITGLGEDSEIESEKDFVIESFSFMNNSGDKATTDVMPKSGSLVFSDLIGVADDAKVELRSVYGTVAASALEVEDNVARFCFGDYANIPKGESFRLVLPAGSVYQLAAPDNVNAEVQKKYYVMDSFIDDENVAFPETASVLSNGTMQFELRICGKPGSKVMFYRGDELVCSGDITVMDSGKGSILYWDFGKEVPLDKDVHYRFVIPSGSLSSIYRSDICNREICYDILSGGMTAVTSAHGSSVSVGCSGGVVYIEGVRPGSPVEVFASGGSLVQRCAAVQGVTRLPLPGHGCYVVRVGGKAYKVVA